MGVTTMPEALTSPPALADIIVAIVVAILAYGATSVIALRRDIRKGKVDDVSLFNQVRQAASEQMTDMRNDLLELRDRVDKSEARADKAERNLTRVRSVLRESLEHMNRLEHVLKGQGLTVPERPMVLRVEGDDFES
jgi:hypothetical protein